MFMVSDKGVYLRTTLREDVHKRLTEMAKSYATGMQKWDYGVAIQILLDFYEQHNSVAQINQKVDYLAQGISELHIRISEQKQLQKEEREPEYVEMLGGERIEK